MKNKKILIFVALFLLCFVPKVGILSIRMPIWGSVVDSVTNAPLSNLIVVRIIEKEHANLAGGNISSFGYAVKTDKNGKFFFGPKFFWVFPFLETINDDWINVNTSLLLGLFGHNSLLLENFESVVKVANDDSVNKDYHQLGYVGVDYFLKRAEINHFRFNEIKLSPKVANLNDCHRDLICEERNPFDLAIKLKDENLCLSIENNLDKKQCAEIIAIAKNNPSVCKLIGESRRCLDLLDLYSQQRNNIANMETEKEIKIRLGCSTGYLPKERRLLCNSLMSQ